MTEPQADRTVPKWPWERKDTHRYCFKYRRRHWVSNGHLAIAVRHVPPYRNRWTEITPRLRSRTWKQRGVFKEVGTPVRRSHAVFRVKKERIRGNADPAKSLVRIGTYYFDQQYVELLEQLWPRSHWCQKINAFQLIHHGKIVAVVMPVSYQQRHVDCIQKDTRAKRTANGARIVAVQPLRT
jgi:hypothetical protein